jgi:hypothetical protein
MAALGKYSIATFVTATVLLAYFSIESPAAEHWTEEALLHDGHTIEVERSVSFNFGQGELSNALTKWPNQYSISAKNPDTGKAVTWSGEKNFNPILLDFSNKVPHLVVVATSVFSNIKQYGCPEIPYIFFKYEDKDGRWKQIEPREFPPELLHANLSFDYDGTYMKDGKRQTKEDIDRINAGGERSSGGYTTRAIPTNFASWQSHYKNQYRVGHYRDGCRYSVPSNEDSSHPQTPGKPYQKVGLEILETKVYEPEWIIKGNNQIQSRDWEAISWDVERSKKCQALVRRVGDDSDKPELRGWLLFVNDPTGSKKARDSGASFCNTEAIWFTEYATDPRYVILTKFTVAGDFVYRIGFERPDTPSHYLGHIMQPTFREDDGYLYFEWWNTNQSGWDRHIKRAMKVRLHEPQPAISVGTS